MITLNSLLQSTNLLLLMNVISLWIASRSRY